jgi:hypothetical protein
MTRRRRFPNRPYRPQLVWDLVTLVAVVCYGAAAVVAAAGLFLHLGR